MTWYPRIGCERDVQPTPCHNGKLSSASLLSARWVTSRQPPPSPKSTRHYPIPLHCQHGDNFTPLCLSSSLKSSLECFRKVSSSSQMILVFRCRLPLPFTDCRLLLLIATLAESARLFGGRHVDLRHSSTNSHVANSKGHRCKWWKVEIFINKYHSYLSISTTATENIPHKHG